MQPTPVRRLLQLSTATIKSGLTMTDAGMKFVGQASRYLSRYSRDNLLPAQDQRAFNMDAATSEFANRLVRLTQRRSLTSTEYARNVLDAASTSFAHVAPQSAGELLTLPMEFLSSVGTLATQEGLRSLPVAQAVPPERLVDFVAFVIEIFSDLEIYFTLSYQQEIERLRTVIERERNETAAQLALGRTLMKCGLFIEATAVLEPLLQNPAVGKSAAYECMVCEYNLGRYPNAMRNGMSCLAFDSKNKRAMHWLWLSAEAAGGYPDSVPEAVRMDVRNGLHPATVDLHEVADVTGLAKVSGGRGAAVFDINGDGQLDVVVAGAHSGCSLFRNDGKGHFTDVSVGSGLDECVYAFAIAAGDYNNDGLPDLYISSLGFFNGEGKLMRNNGDGTFTDVTSEAGLSSWGPGFTATWVDYDCDGHLDLFVANNLGGLFDRKTPNRLFHNNGDGTFTDVTRDAGLHSDLPTIGAAWGDINNDGFPDLFVSNVGGAQLFRNNRDGTFTDVSRESGVDIPCIGSAALWFDYDDDGWLDILQTTYSRPLDAIHTLQHGYGPPQGVPSRLFRNNRDGTFSLVSREAGITGCWGTMSVAVGDFNNDGRQDILLGNGDPSIDRCEPAVLLQQDGSGTYRDVTFSAGMPITGKGHGVLMADLANDGRQHLLVANGGLYPGDLQATAVFRPATLPGNYLNIRLAGRYSNRDAIGARIALTANGRRQHRLVSGGSNFGCSPLQQHFGLGSSTHVDSADVVWPNGLRQHFRSIPCNQTIELVEGATDIRPRNRDHVSDERQIPPYSEFR